MRISVFVSILPPRQRPGKPTCYDIFTTKTTLNQFLIWQLARNWLRGIGGIEIGKWLLMTPLIIGLFIDKLVRFSRIWILFVFDTWQDDFLRIGLYIYFVANLTFNSLWFVKVLTSKIWMQTFYWFHLIFFCFISFLFEFNQVILILTDARL